MERVDGDRGNGGESQIGAARFEDDGQVGLGGSPEEPVRDGSRRGGRMDWRAPLGRGRDRVRGKLQGSWGGSEGGRRYRSCQRPMSSSLPSTG